MDAIAVPGEKQLAFMDWEFGLFFHFGIRSFFPGHVDWDQRPMPLSAFDPTQFDPEQWIREAKDAGARYAILVCKHHDGFANWPTKYSSYSVKNTPWKNGRGDVVREFVDACRKYGLKTGLYYSPAQWGGETDFSEPKAYDDYFIHQITELLTDYGKIDYLWFDGCGSENHTYDKPRIIRAIRSLQPDILIFQMWDPDTRWIGNEDGYAPMRNENSTAQVGISIQTKEKEQLSQTLFLPAECDCKLRSTWFDCEDNEDTIKTAEELMGMYEMSVGRGANFLLNIGPDSRGLLPDQDVERLRAFGALLKKRYGTPLSAFGRITRESEDTWTLSLKEGERPALVNRLTILENLRSGQGARHFRVYCHLPCNCDQKICVYQGDTIGHKAICVFPTIRTGRIELQITDEAKPTEIQAMQAYFAEA